MIPPMIASCEYACGWGCNDDFSGRRGGPLYLPDISGPGSLNCIEKMDHGLRISIPPGLNRKLHPMTEPMLSASPVRISITDRSYLY